MQCRVFTRKCVLAEDGWHRLLRIDFVITMYSSIAKVSGHLMTLTLGLAQIITHFSAKPRVRAIGVRILL